MQVKPIKTDIFREGEQLVSFITAHIPSLAEGSVLVVTSKIAALAERRTAEASEEARLIKEESTWQRATKYGTLTLKDGILMWNAGIDESNAGGKIILLPRDSYATAAAIRTALRSHYSVTNLGVVLSDSRILPARAGVVGIALGYAGFRGLRDYRGADDLFGRPLKYTQTDIADSLATAAVLVMGEGSERQPLALIEDAPVAFTDEVDPREIIVDPESDMYRDLFR